MKYRDVNLRAWASPPVSGRGLRMRAATAAAVVLVLVAAIVYLHLQAPRNDGARHAVLGHLGEMKRLDARWDIAVLRARAEFAQPPATAADADEALARARRALSAAAKDAGSPALAGALPALDAALADKARLVSVFLKSSAGLKQALDLVTGAEHEIAGLVRGAWRDFPDRERLVAVENLVVLLLAEAQEYYLAPGERLRKSIDALLDDLGDAAARLPPALTSGLARLSGNVQALLKAKPGEQALYDRLAYHSAGPRIDALIRAYHHEAEAAQALREVNQLHINACGAALLVALGYLTFLLMVARRRA